MRRGRHRMVDEQERRPLRRVGERLEHLPEPRAAVQQLEPVQRHDPERRLRQLDRRFSLRHERKAVPDRVRAGVDHVHAAQVRRRPCTGRVVDLREPGRQAAIDLLREGMAEVEAAEAALDVRDRHAQRTADDRAEDSRHRVSVHEDERPSGSVPQLSPQPPSLPRV